MRNGPAVVLLPVKPPARGKSRLAGLGPGVRRDLAEAFALDTLAAARAAEGVEAIVVVCSDRAFAGRVSLAGVAVVPDPVPGDLNASLARVVGDLPPSRQVVALCADLPALRAEDLAAAVAAAPAAPAFVPDAAGTGTTAFLAPAARFHSRFGPGSAAAHRAGGAVAVGQDLGSLRADVDDEAALARAVGLGVGTHTAAVLARS
jgi:2-phospho-L-lactate guanylyltransferase